MPLPSKPQLKINALLRLTKEYDEYNEEERGLEAKIKSLESEPSADDYEIRNTKRVLEETRKVRARVAQAVKEHINEVSKLGGLKADEETQARQALEAANKALK